jgi:hypothetical protein
VRLGKKGREKERANGEMVGGRGLAALALTIADERNTMGQASIAAACCAPTRESCGRQSIGFQGEGATPFCSIAKGARASITMDGQEQPATMLGHGQNVQGGRGP